LNLDIRPATLEDAEAIAAFNIALALETEDLVLDPAIVVPGVKRLIQSPAFGHYTVAWQGEERAACAMTTHEWSDWRNGQIWWFQSVFVAPKYRRKGAFSAIYNHIEDKARQDPSVCGLRLYVERENTNAQATYQAMGMSETHYRLYERMLD